MKLKKETEKHGMIGMYWTIASFVALGLLVRIYGDPISIENKFLEVIVLLALFPIIAPSVIASWITYSSSILYWLIFGIGVLTIGPLVAIRIGRLKKGNRGDKGGKRKAQRRK